MNFKSRFLLSLNSLTLKIKLTFWGFKYSMDFMYFLKTTLLRYNLQTIKSIYCKYTIQWFWINLWSGVTITTIQFQNFSLRKDPPCLFLVSSYPVLGNHWSASVPSFCIWLFLLSIFVEVQSYCTCNSGSFLFIAE